MQACRNWSVLLLLIFSLPLAAFDSVDEQIDSYLAILGGGDHLARIQMLKRLQWSGISDPRLYDAIEELPLREIGLAKPNRPELDDITHRIRALGYSGNEKYRPTLERLGREAANKKIRNHARKALQQLGQFKTWNEKIAQSDIATSGKSTEVATYMRMLNTNDVMVQRLAARATFHERRMDKDLLDLTAAKLRGLYAQPGLGGQALDTAAWFVKALGMSGNYTDLLIEVNQATPYKKLKKYSIKYIPQ